MENNESGGKSGIHAIANLIGSYHSMVNCLKKGGMKMSERKFAFFNFSKQYYVG